MANILLQNSTVDERYDLLKYLAENEIIDMHRVWEEMQMKQIEKIKKEHLKTHGEFSQRLDRGKRYYFTTLDRKPIRAKTEEELWQKLLIKYKEKNSAPTIAEVYMDKYNDKCLSGASRRKYKRNYSTYIVNTGLSEMKMDEINADMLERFVKGVIKERQLNTKQYSDFVWILKDILKRAYKRKYIKFSPDTFFKNIEIEKNEIRRVKKQPLCKLIFTDEETMKILGYIKEHPTIHNLAIEMIFRTGGRGGEISVLKKEDFDRDAMKVVISKTEITKDMEDATPDEIERNEGSSIAKTICVIQDYPKTEDGCRDIYLEEKAIELLDKILLLNPDGEYLFSINGKRIRTNALRRSLYRICDAVEVPRRGLHCIRRFYATTLLDAHTDEEIVMSQLGHADINTTRNYYQYCKSEVYKKQEQIKKAINY